MNKFLSKVIIISGLINNVLGNSLPPCPENTLPPTFESKVMLQMMINQKQHVRV